MSSDPTPERWILGLALLAFALVVLASAWLCDDAYITFRSLHNLWAGHGLRWNPAERVQTFSHPLWALLLAPLQALTGEVYFAALGLSLACSFGAVALLALRVARTAALGGLAVAILVLSRAFVDYSTSGLENPLTHLLLALFLLAWFEDADADRRSAQRRLTRLALAAGLAALNRLDAILLVGPALLQACTRSGGTRRLRGLALGFLPLAAWEIFALVYYGFPFPNTAYAKLATGIEPTRLWAQGLAYLGDSLQRDPITLIAIAAACVSALALRTPRAAAFAVGIALHLLYVVHIGGDFMSGRYLSAPLFCAVALLARLPARLPQARRVALVGAALALALGFAAPHPTLLARSDYGVGWPVQTPSHGVTDERADYYPMTGLLRVLARTGSPLRHPWAARGNADRRKPLRVVVAGPVGLYGYHLGPGKHLIDRFALVDPLLARLPVNSSDEWRIGHFPRAIPDGYYETLDSGRNRIRDPDLAAYWDALALVTRGPLLDAGRWREIARLNLGLRDALLDQYLARAAASRQAPSSSVR